MSTPHRNPSFAEATKISQITSQEYKSSVHEDWSYGPGAHGGTLASILWKAIVKHFQTTQAKNKQLDVIAFHVEFIRPGILGTAVVVIKDVRIGRGSSMVQATLLQGDKERTTAFATYDFSENRLLELSMTLTNARIINRSTSKGITMPTGYRLDPPIPPINFNNVLTNKDPSWVKYDLPYREDSQNKFFSNITGVIERRPCADKDVVQLWMSLRPSEERWTTDMIPVACDAFNPALENYFDGLFSVQGVTRMALEWEKNGPPDAPVQTVCSLLDLSSLSKSDADFCNSYQAGPRYYTTVNMSIDLKRALPEEGTKWLFARMRTLDVRDGRLDVRGELWDKHGNLIALMQYLWFVVDTSRSVIAQASRENGNGRSKI